MRLNDWHKQAEEYRDIDRAILRELEARMYVYILSEKAGHGGADNDLFTVGFYDPAGKFQPESDYGTREKAAERVAYLNGGK